VCEATSLGGLFPLVRWASIQDVASPGATMRLNEGQTIREVPSGKVLQGQLTLSNGIGRTSTGQVSTQSREKKASLYTTGDCPCIPYVWIEAARLFHKALRVDPKLAIGLPRLEDASIGLAGHADRAGKP